MDKNEAYKTIETPTTFIVVYNHEDVIGEFKEFEDARFFAYICALHGDPGDNFTVYEAKAGFEVEK